MTNQKTLFYFFFHLNGTVIIILLGIKWVVGNVVGTEEFIVSTSI